MGGLLQERLVGNLHALQPAGAQVTLTLLPLAAGGRLTGLPAPLIILVILAVIIIGLVTTVRAVSRRASRRR
jgi:hypothetical protein